MKEQQARKQLVKMLKDLTGGSVLGLFAQVYLELAKQAHRNGDATAHEQFTMAHNALVVVGHGIDAICPR
jgi:hypothetical protein